MIDVNQRLADANKGDSWLIIVCRYADIAREVAAERDELREDLANEEVALGYAQYDLQRMTVEWESLRNYVLAGYDQPLDLSAENIRAVAREAKKSIQAAYRRLHD